MDVPLFDRLGALLRAESSDVVGSRGRLGLTVVAVALLVGSPVIDAVNSFWLRILAEILLFALFAISLDLVFGYTGLPSFGHAAMFGAGGYAAAFLLIDDVQNLLVVLAVAVLISAIVATVVGALSIRGRGLFFAFLTLAFAQIFYIAVFVDLPATLLGVESVTHGDDGLVGFPGFELFGLSLSGSLPYFLLTLVLVSLSVGLIVRIANSPFGRTLQGISENENRMAALGYDVSLYKVVGFVISGAFTGLAGALFVPLQGVAHPDLLYWVTSGDVIIMILIGGMGTLWGAMVGAATVLLFEHAMSQFGNWRLLLGLLFVTVVIFLPKGIAGAVQALRSDPGAAFTNLRKAARRYVESVRN
jgi:branched-chain amino acid transport system permease protein